MCKKLLDDILFHIQVLVCQTLILRSEIKSMEKQSLFSASILLFCSCLSGQFLYANSYAF